MAGDLHSQYLIEVRRFGDQVGKEKFGAFAEEKIFQSSRLGGGQIVFAKVDDPRNVHVHILRNLCTVFGSWRWKLFEVPAINIGLERTLRHSGGKPGEDERVRLQSVNLRALALALAVIEVIRLRV